MQWIDVKVCLKWRIILQSPSYDRFDREDAAYLIRLEADFHHIVSGLGTQFRS